MRLVPIAASVAVVLAACSSKDAPQGDQSGTAETAAAAIPEVTFHANDFAFEGPDTIPSGVTQITMANDGPSDHHLILVRLDPAHSFADLTAALATGEMPDWMAAVGGDGGVATGMTNTTIQDLQPGTHAVLCFFQNGPDQPPHFALGMAHELTVSSERNPAVLPVADAEIRLVDYQFEMPELKAGEQLINLVNAGTEVHEIVVERLPEGMTAEAYLAAQDTDAETMNNSIGGNGALSPGESNLWRANLTPGRYVALCFVPAPDGEPHVKKGMVKEFTVS